MNHKELLLLSIGVFLTVVAWLVADIYHINKTRQIEFSTKIIKKINVPIKSDVFKELKRRTP